MSLPIENYKLLLVHFEKLKCLNDIEITIDKPLTAIMGENGSGKTTVIHALACIYQPLNSGENHKFPEFLVPNTDALWKGSKLTVWNEYTDELGRKTFIQKIYGKAKDRWSPRYETRPERDVFYIGIDSCLPEIEKKTSQSMIKYSSKVKEDRISQRIVKESAYVLNKQYCKLMDHEYHNKQFSGIELLSGLKYSSLSMGTGEQRTIKIFEKIFNAEPYSLILIDELDLLLHTAAFKRLVERLHTIAVERNLQIVFTTHSLAMQDLRKYSDIRYIKNEILPDGSTTSMVYNSITSDLIYNMSGIQEVPIQIYVEDIAAKVIVRYLVKQLNMSSKVNITTYGAVENAFTIAASKVLTNVKCDNILVVLDGDKYRDQDEKKIQIKKRLTGTEEDIDEKRNKAVAMISELLLPDQRPPEKFIYDMLIKYGDDSSELVRTAREIYAVSDPHGWIYSIVVRMHDSEENVMKDIVNEISHNDEWDNYVSQVYSWLKQRRNI